MFVTDLSILWQVCKCAICLKYFALRGVTCLRRRKYVVGNSFERFIFCGYPNRISKSLQPFKNKLTPTVKVAYVPLHEK